ncbi:hypothetical protein [Marivita sp.]|uniref:hypothetical protein n=1 Tax=Marivita sp. TaxID=2003365 RepID=UPI0025C4EBFA|nr:hypothetical protein [Marivita sp.]
MQITSETIAVIAGGAPGLGAAMSRMLSAQVPIPSRSGDPTQFAALVRHIVDTRMRCGEVIGLDSAIRMASR